MQYTIKMVILSTGVTNQVFGGTEYWWSPPLRFYDKIEEKSRWTTNSLALVIVLLVLKLFFHCCCFFAVSNLKICRMQSKQTF